MEFSRYALYFAPPEGADWTRLATAWLGWDMEPGAEVAPPEAPGIDVAGITERPRKYGLHGTIKPPFRLAEGMDFEALHDGFARFCATQAPVTLDGLALTRLGRFLALTPLGETDALSALAARTVETLDPFRAPLTEAELDKRRKSGLNARQDALLTRWGYPYVMDQFRFHITLSGKLDRDTAEQVRDALLPYVEPRLPRPFAVDALTLCGEDSTGYFHELHRYALSG